MHKCLYSYQIGILFDTNILNAASNAINSVSNLIIILLGVLHGFTAWQSKRNSKKLDQTKEAVDVAAQNTIEIKDAVTTQTNSET